MPQRELVQTYLYDLVHGQKQGRMATVMLGMLQVFSVIYSGVISLALNLYKIGVLPTRRLPCKVISLGNITVGGTGKTPTAQCLARAICDAGYKVAILNRGYRAKWRGDVGLVSDGQKIYMTAAEAGDEAYQLAKSLPGVALLIGKNRYRTGTFACAKLGVQIVILDDGYQHWRLHRDVDIVLIDSSNTFGNNCVLPRGTLREPLPNLKRADAFLLTKVDQAGEEDKEQLKTILAHYNPRALVVESVHDPRYFQEIANWYKNDQSNIIALDEIKDKRVLVFSAIGNPGSFEHTVRLLEPGSINTVRYPDHHHYGMAEMQCIIQKAVDRDAEVLITTEKDAVKIPPEFIHSGRRLPLWVLGIEVKMADDGVEMMKLINR